MRTSCPLFRSLTNNIMGSGVEQRGTKCVSEYVFPLIAPILSVRSGHFLSQLGAVRARTEGQSAGWRTKLSLTEGTESEASVAFSTEFSSNVSFSLTSFPWASQWGNLKESPCMFGSVVERKKRGIWCALWGSQWNQSESAGPERTLETADCHASPDTTRTVSHTWCYVARLCLIMCYVQTFSKWINAKVCARKSIQ